MRISIPKERPQHQRIAALPQPTERRHRFQWISSYDRPESHDLRRLHREMCDFYATAEQNSSYHTIATSGNEDLLDGNHRAQEAVLTYARPGATVIEFSCGGGIAAKYFVAAKSLYFGFDISSPGSHAGSVGVFACGSAYETPFRSGTADLVVSFYSIEHVVWPLSYLNEMIRVTRPGGHVALAFPDYVARPSRVIPSVRFGMTPGSIKAKLRRGNYLDAVRSYLERLFIYRMKILKLRHQIVNKGRLRFMIQTLPSCLSEPYSIDNDAIYLASEEEVASYLTLNGCVVKERSRNLVDSQGKSLDVTLTGNGLVIAERVSRATKCT